VSVTAPYNADFDGDEMNAHIPQSYEASTELSEIAAVPHQIVTPRHAKPLIGVVQDALVGSYRITQPHVDFNRREFMNMMMWNKRFEGYMPIAGRRVEGKAGRWTGQQVLSQLLPPINLEMGNGLYKDNKSKDNMVKIKEGTIQHGIFDKDIFSKPSKGIVHVTFRDYGPTDTVNLIDSVQNTIEQFLVYNGFSVGISDLIADEDTRKQMEDVVKKRKAAIEDILTDYCQIVPTIAPPPPIRIPVTPAPAPAPAESIHEGWHAMQRKRYETKKFTPPGYGHHVVWSAHRVRSYMKALNLKPTVYDTNIRALAKIAGVHPYDFLWKTNPVAFGEKQGLSRYKMKQMMGQAFDRMNWRFSNGY
jgi:hypothetical protein